MGTSNKPRFLYTEEQKKYIADNAARMTLEEISDAFHKRFGIRKTPRQFKDYCVRHKIRRSTIERYTQEKRDFIYDYFVVRKHTLPETVKEYNRRFPDDPMTNARMNGYIGFNKLKNGMLGRNNPTQFKKGHTPYNTLDDGVVTTWGDQVMIKIDGTFVRLDHYTYERKHGVKIPFRGCILHLDRDESNCDPDNLVLATYQEKIGLTKMKLTEDVDTNRMIIANVKLEAALRKRTKGN